MLEMVNKSLAHIEQMKEDYFKTHEETYKPAVAIILHDIQKRIMMKYLNKVIK